MKQDGVSSLKGKVLETINRHDLLAEGSSVIIGFSGGPDSLCLLDFLIEIRNEYGLSLYPVHINHNLRGEEANRDEEFCREFSESRGLRLKTFSFDCEKMAKEDGVTTEEAGRRFRYEAFLKTAEEALKERPGFPAMVAVAQNADDQAETVLMRVLRGTGTDGLSGIPYKRKMDETDKDIYVARPLLDVFREEILSYCEMRELNPRFDHTNEEPIYNRNKIRLELIPELERVYNPNIKNALIRLAVSAQEDRRFLDSVSALVLDEAKAAKSASGHKESPVILKRESLLNEDPSVRRRVISMAIKEAGLTEDVVFNHYDSMINVITSDNPSGHVDLPKGFGFWREYDFIKIGKAEAPSRDSWKFTVNILSKDEYSNMGRESGLFAAFDMDLLEAEFGQRAIDGLEFRGRRPGDEIKTTGGTKKLQDLLVDMKIPKKDRDDVRVFALGSQILWAINPINGMKIRYSSKWKISESTARVAYIVLFV